MKKMFEKPVCETVGFGDDVITSSGCCDTGGIQWPTDSTCTGANIECTCQVNHVAGTANCTPCPAYN